MNVGIDARVLEKNMTGIGRFLACLLQHIPEVDPQNEYYLFGYGKVGVGNERFHSIATAPAFSSSKMFSPLWLHYVLPGQLKAHQIDVLYSPNFLAPPKRVASRWKSIVVVCDTFHKLQKQFLALYYRMYINPVLERSIAHSDAIVTISQHSKLDIVRSYSVAPERVRVIYPSAEHRFNPQTLEGSRRKEIAERLKLPGRFVLCVGVVEARKNIIGLTRIADLLKRKGITTPIVLIGRAGFGFAKIMDEVRKRDNMLYISYVNDDVLPDVFKMASVFVFPSYYEGFGIPPLEAMQSGIPVVTSNTSSLPEVVGGAGSMFHPDDAEGFAAEIARLLEDETYAATKSKLGIIEAAKFSARDSASSLVQLFSLVGT